MHRHRKSKLRKHDIALEGAAGREAALRELCSRLRFWKVCGGKMCQRAKACAGEAETCFSRHWPLVPQTVKVGVRAFVKASVAGLSKPEIAAEVERQQRRWRDIEAKAAASEPPRQPPLSPKPRPIAQPRVRAL